VSSLENFIANSKRSCIITNKLSSSIVKIRIKTSLLLFTTSSGPAHKEKKKEILVRDRKIII